MATRTDPYHDEIINACRDLGAFGTNIVWAKLPITPEPDDMLAQHDDLALLCRKVDRLVLAVGEYVNANTSYKVDLSLWKDQLFGALEGNAFYECEEAAQDARDQMEIMSADDRYEAMRDPLISHQWENER